MWVSFKTMYKCGGFLFVYKNAKYKHFFIKIVFVTFFKMCSKTPHENGDHQSKRR